MTVYNSQVSIECIQTTLQREEYIIPVYYYIEPLGEPSALLGSELGRASHSGQRRVLGIVTPESHVIWSNDPNIQFHPDLWNLAGTSREALFQNKKDPGEFIPEVGIFAYDYNALFQAAVHIVSSLPHHTLGVRMELLPKNDEALYRGNIYDLQQNMYLLAQEYGVVL